MKMTPRTPRTERTERRLGDWITHNRVQVVSSREMIDVIDYPPFLNTLDKLLMPDATSVYAKRQVEAVTIRVPIESLVNLVNAEHKLNMLMRLPEVREAVFYNTLNGYLDQ